MQARCLLESKLSDRVHKRHAQHASGKMVGFCSEYQFPLKDNFPGGSYSLLCFKASQTLCVQVERQGVTKDYQ